MPIVARNPADLTGQLAEAVGRYHPELSEHRVTWTVLGARAAEPKPKKPPKNGAPAPEPRPPRPPVVEGGLPVPAKVQFPSETQRLAGSTMAILTLDLDHWETLLPEERWALLDHYTARAEIVLDPETAEPVVLQDGRVKLRKRRYDHAIGVYADVVSRHGRHALEVIALRAAAADVERWAKDAREPAAPGAVA